MSNQIRRELSVSNLLFFAIALLFHGVCFAQITHDVELKARVADTITHAIESPIHPDFDFVGEWENDTIQNGERARAGQIRWKFEAEGKFTHLRFYLDGTYEIVGKDLTITTNKTVIYEVLRAFDNTLEVKQINPNFGLVSPQFTLVRIIEPD